MIELHKINESYYRVFSTFEVEQEIRDYFTFKVPGHQFSPKFKARLWDGTISLYDQKTKKLPCGLYDLLMMFAKESKYEVLFKESELFSEAQPKNEVTLDDIIEYVDSLELASKHGPIEVRPYQYDAIFKAIRDKRITLVSPTSSGKSLIIYCAIRWILDQSPDDRLILMVPNIQLVNQMFSDFEEYSISNGFVVSKHFQKLYGGQSRVLNMPILISTWQSLSSITKDKQRAAELFSMYAGVIVDECHTAKGKEIQSLLERLTNARYRIGTTGTLQSEKTHKLVIEGFLGPAYQVITTRELIDNGQVSNLKIKPIVLSYDDADRQFCKGFDYADETTFLVTHQKRLDVMAKMTSSMKGTTLIMVSRRDAHAVPLFEAIKKYATKPVYFVAGTVDADDREEIRLKANNEDCIIVATFKTMSTGTNIPNIRNVVFGSTSKAMITVLQSIGRGLRLHTDKSHMNLYDFIDDMRYKKRENYAYQHSEVRFKIYRKERFEIQQPIVISL